MGKRVEDVHGGLKILGSIPSASGYSMRAGAHRLSTLRLTAVPWRAIRAGRVVHDEGGRTAHGSYDRCRSLQMPFDESHTEGELALSHASARMWSQAHLQNNYHITQESRQESALRCSSRLSVSSGAVRATIRALVRVSGRVEVGHETVAVLTPSPALFTRKEGGLRVSCVPPQPLRRYWSVRAGLWSLNAQLN